ncbi:MAG TPA: methyltransferase [Luteitalea sp.]|nr:methyltransferase [Luteitalea sp.]
MSSILVDPTTAHALSQAMSAPAADPRLAPTPHQHVLQVATGYMLSSALHVVVSLQIADLIAAGTTGVVDLARLAHVKEDGLYRVLRLLASAGVFTEVAPRQFGLTPAAEVLRRDRQDSVHDLVNWIADPFHFRVYAEAAATMESGVPAVEHATGAPAFEYLARDAAESAIFNDAMTSMSAQVMPAVLAGYDFSDVKVLVDVAGGHGHVVCSVLEQYPAMRGILFDLDHVIAGAEPRLAARGLGARCQLAVGDFFTAVPHGGDAYLLKHIVHDWDDARAITILRNIRAALVGVQTGRVIMLESVIGPGDAPDFGKLVDYEMLMMTGGRERTAEEFRTLLARAGFELTRIVRVDAPLSIIEARPR